MPLHFHLRISLTLISYWIMLFSLMLVLLYPTLLSWAIMVFAIVIFLECLDLVNELKKEKKEGD